MKNNREKELLGKLFTGLVFRIVFWTVSIPILFFVIVVIILNSDFQWLYNYSPNLYYGCVTFFNTLISSPFTYILLILVWFVGLLIFIFKLLSQVFSYLSALSSASDQLLDKNIEYIELPLELEAIAQRMNHLKLESLKNERLARENEQKKDDLIVYLAHDLKTPLTSLIGYLSLLDEIKDMPSKQKEKYIEIALLKSYKLEDLINELFEITRFNSSKIILEKEELNLNLMLEQIVDDFYPTLKEHNKKIKINSKQLITLDGDSNKLARVFNNIIKNAISYSSKDSTITVDINKFGKFANIIISNKGKKISEDKLNKIFEKFYRLDTSRTSKTGGSGLGLAIAKEIVELHNGKISVTSDDNYTRFSVSLPLSD